MSDEQVYAGVEKALRKYFGKRGDRVVQDNLNCVKRGYGEMKEIPAAVMLRDVRACHAEIRGDTSECRLPHVGIGCHKLSLLKWHIATVHATYSRPSAVIDPHDEPTSRSLAMIAANRPPRPR